MKIEFRKAKLNAVNMAKLEKVNSIIEMYRGMGYTLTLRQLYYRLVIENAIANSNKEYARLIHLLTEGRMAGIVDWDGIEDRVRIPYLPYFNHDTDDAINDAKEQYRLNRQEGQDNHIELWVEKDAISNILKVRTHHYGIHLMVNRGFSSTTAMYMATERINRAIENGKTPYILYLGDHDPSGLCMALTDIPDRLNKDFGVDVEVKHIGITMKQIKKYNPPTNPAKITDSRAKWYIKNWGNHSWEVDALEPDVLHTLINSEIEGLMDMPAFNSILEQEKKDISYLGEVPRILVEYPEIQEKVESISEQLATVNDNLIEVTQLHNRTDAELKTVKSENETYAKNQPVIIKTAYNQAIDDAVALWKKGDRTSQSDFLKLKK